MAPRTAIDSPVPRGRLGATLRGASPVLIRRARAELVQDAFAALAMVVGLAAGFTTSALVAFLAMRPWTWL